MPARLLLRLLRWLRWHQWLPSRQSRPSHQSHQSRQSHQSPPPCDDDDGDDDAACGCSGSLPVLPSRATPQARPSTLPGLALQAKHPGRTPAFPMRPQTAPQSKLKQYASYPSPFRFLDDPFSDHSSLRYANAVPSGARSKILSICEEFAPDANLSINHFACRYTLCVVPAPICVESPNTGRPPSQNARRPNSLAARLAAPPSSPYTAGTSP